MASLATFRKMQKDRQTIYDVIGQLAGQVIIEQSINVMDFASLRDLLKRKAGIDVPVSVVKASLRRVNYVTVEKAGFTTNNNLTTELRDKTIEELESNNRKDQEVYDSLVSFVEQKLQKSLTDEEKELLIKNFCAYMVNDSYDVKYAEYISNFFIVKERDKDFMEQMANIREGLIIFLGLAYNAQDYQIDAVDTPLCLYLDTEIIFHMAGYNGELFKNLFEEFYDQVTAVNKKARKTVVKLLYFEETLNEIEHYFRTAEDIVDRKARLDISKMAMYTIVSNCKESYDVIQMKADLKLLLAEKRIILDNQNNYYDKEHVEFNVDHQQILDSFSNDDFDENKVYEKLRLINYVYIKRGHKSQRLFRNVGHILVSGNTMTFKVANFIENQVETVPLVWNLGNLTNRFWLTLNKGIVPSTQLKSFDLLSKARIVLSNKLNSSVERMFKQINEEVAAGSLTKERADIGIIELRKNNLAPENINADNAAQIMDIIDEKSYEHMIAESEARWRKSKETIDKQEKKINNLDEEISKIKTEHSQVVSLLLDRTNNDARNVYKEDIEKYEDDKSKYVRRQFCKDWVKELCLSIGTLLFVIIVIVFNRILQDKYNWQIDLIAVVAFIIALFYTDDNRHPVQDAFRFVFCKEIRDKVKLRIAEEYEQNNSRPVLQLKTEDDIKKVISTEKI